jgi:LysR family glycine cleavage system transcriptional activator
MGSFYREHPHFHVNLSVRTRPFLFEDAALDAAIYPGESGWPGTVAHFLLPETLVAVVSPRLLAGRRQLRPPDLVTFTLLQASTRPTAWRDWFERQGVQVANAVAGPRYELFSMQTQAAIHGLGVALVPDFLVENELATGLLVRAVQQSARSTRSYYLIHPQHPSRGAGLSMFVEWLRREAQQYGAGNAAG